MGLIQLPDVKLSPDQHIVPLRYEHLTRLKLKEHEQEYARSIPNYIDYVWDNSVDGSSWAGIWRGRVVAAFGMRFYWQGVAEAWMLPGEGIEHNAISLVKGARSLFDIAIERNEIRRLQIAVKVENDTAYKFAKAVGFGVESVMRKFGPEGSDYYLMTRF